MRDQMVGDQWAGTYDSNLIRRIATPLPAERPTNLRQGRQQLCFQADRCPYTSRYVAVDSHLAERKGSANSVSGVAGERPAGRKFAQDIANACNQLAGEGYEVFSIIPTVGGRVVELTADEDETESHEQTQGPPTDSVSAFIKSVGTSPVTPDELAMEEYEPMAVGYRVTDGAIITARLRG